MAEVAHEQHFKALRGSWYGLGGHMANRAWAALTYIENQPGDDRPLLLRYLCEHHELWDTSEREIPPPEYRFSDEEVKENLGPSQGRVLDALLDAEIAAKPTEDEFYEHLWNHIHNPFFSDARTQGFALYWALIDDRIPYFQVGSGLKMSDDDYDQRRMAHYSDFAKMRFLLRLEFDQKTQEADLLLDILEKTKDRSDRVILLSDLINLAEERGASRRDLERNFA